MVQHIFSMHGALFLILSIKNRYMINKNKVKRLPCGQWLFDHRAAWVLDLRSGQAKHRTLGPQTPACAHPARCKRHPLPYMAPRYGQPDPALQRAPGRCSLRHVTITRTDPGTPTLGIPRAGSLSHFPVKFKVPKAKLSPALPGLLTSTQPR